MNYDKQLPPVQHLLELAKIMYFPARRSEVEAFAKKYGTTSEVIDFIDLFPADEIFENRVDFMTRCEEVEMLIAGIRLSPIEHLKSPQE